MVSFNGAENLIEIGWIRNNQKHGNRMILDGDTMAILDQGYYVNDVRKEDMKEDVKFRNFTRD